MTHDVNEAVRMVDNWRERCPGTLRQKKLVKVAVQKERRRLRRIFKKIKHIIYVLEGTDEIWYKNSDCAVGVIAMGFSLKRLAQHPNAVPMEFYHAMFMKPDQSLPVQLLRGQDKIALEAINMTPREWLKLNNYVLV